MAGAVGIVFGLCLLSFTLGAAMMYVVLRRREDAGEPSSADAPSPESAARPDAWVEKPAVEPVQSDYDSRPIHRNPVVGLPQMEPALAALAEPVAEVEAVAEPVEVAGEVEEAEDESPDAEVAEPENVGADGYDQDGDIDPPEGDLEAPEPTVAPGTDSSEAEKAPEAIVTAALPGPAVPQPVEHTTSAERDDFRQRYLRTFEEARRKASSN